MMSAAFTKTAEDAVVRAHRDYGEVVRLLKFIPSATGGIYRQARKQYEPALEIIGKVSRETQTEMVGATGEASERTLRMTIPVRLVEEVFGTSTPTAQMITSADLFIIDERVWRVVQCNLTGRFVDRPFIFDMMLREKVGEKEVDYL